MIDVKITEGAEGVVATDLSGFFVGWPHQPDDHRRLEILRAATTAFVARDDHGRLVDLACDEDVVPFYERLGGTRLNAMSWRHHHRLTPPPELP